MIRTPPAALLVVLSVLSIACAAVMNLDDPVSVEKATSVDRDPSGRLTKFKSPAGRGRDANVEWRYSLRCIRSRTVEIWRLHITTYHYGEWHSYDAAHDQDGVAYEARRGHKDTHCTRGRSCRLEEQVSIDISREMLEQHRAGFRMRVSGDGTEFWASVPGGMVQGFLNRVERE